ncbi:hypothetical protein NCCNTM_07690 [Mycolicibacterium sp. NCC-Tsukiji]|nr:hypothetical protein NCCNTM_07690 [Mycolicibacterium sp. NCC-Tsukiji]
MVVLAAQLLHGERYLRIEEPGGDRFELRLEVVGLLREIGHCQHLTQLDSVAAGRELGQPDSQRRTVGLWPTPDCGTDVGGRFCLILRQAPKPPPTQGTPLTVGTGPPDRLPVGSKAASAPAAGERPMASAPHAARKVLT